MPFAKLRHEFPGESHDGIGEPIRFLQVAQVTAVLKNDEF
jgi:hypothetical protein